MTLPSELSNRAKKALDVLSQGGEFVHRLERDKYTGREQFKYRLLTKGRAVVKGVSHATFHELCDMGVIRLTLEGRTSVSTYYRLNTDMERG